jgi:hypothetical protein
LNRRRRGAAGRGRVRLKRDQSDTDTRAPLLQRPHYGTPRTGNLVRRSLVVPLTVTDLTFAAAPALAQNMNIKGKGGPDFTDEGLVLNAPAALAGAGNEDVLITGARCSRAPAWEEFP